MQSSDIDTIRQTVSLSEVAAQYGVGMERDGYEWVALCPFHSEDTPSFTIFPGADHVQRFHCFGCGERGDVLDFVQKIKAVDLPGAIRILRGEDARPNIAPAKVRARDIYEGITQLVPAGEIRVGETIRLYNPKRRGHEWEWGQFRPSLVHPYRDAGGALMGYVLRRDFKDGGKETPMVMWVRLPDGTECWSRFPFPKPRPLYGLDQLDREQVIIVEGEKCRDALAKATGRCVISWAGGTYGIHHADWSPLAGKDVIIWPDADEPGVRTAQDIAGRICKQVKRVRIMDVAVAGKPKGWDCADAVAEGWDRRALDAFMRDHVRAWEPPALPAEGSSPSSGGNVRKLPETPVRQARTVQQEAPELATVTNIQTRETVRSDEAWRLNLICKEDGSVKCGVTANWALFLENHPDMAGLFAFDNFKMKVMLMRRPPWEPEGSWTPRPVSDRDFSEAVAWLENLHMTPKVPALVPVIQMIAERSSYDRLIEFLESLEWDGQKRIDKFLPYYFGVENSDYARVVGHNWLISSVARGLNAGCKVDTMPILEGPQGAMKSSAIKALYGEEFFTDNLSDIGSKDAKMEMQGVWGLEVAEMHRLSNAETNEVKKFLTQQIDRFRPPYGRTVIEAPRRVVLCGTINPEGNAYLRDPTGARRFWPIEVDRIDLDALAHDREQIWAEAVALYRAGAKWWVQDGERNVVEAEQEKRTDVDVWISVISDAIRGRRSISQREVFQSIGIPDKDADWRHSTRVGRVMKVLGWEMYRDRSSDGERIMYRDAGARDLVRDLNAAGMSDW